MFKRPWQLLRTILDVCVTPMLEGMGPAAGLDVGNEGEKSLELGSEQLDRWPC